MSTGPGAPLYVPERDAGVDTTVRFTHVGINATVATFAAYAAYAELGVPGVGTVVLWLFAFGAVCSALSWAVTPGFLAGRPALGFAVVADLGEAVALCVLRDAHLMFAGCMLFALTGVFVALHVQPVGLVAHLLIVTSLSCISSALMVIRESTPVPIAMMGATLWLWVLIGAPLATRRIWLSTTAAAELARHDPLTGALNRDGLRHAYRRMAAQAARDAASMMVVVADIDKFKAINDRHGHSVGDQVIVSTARQLEHHFGPRAAIARTGGEEFTVIIVGDHTDLVELIETTPTAADAVGLSVTTSIGAAPCSYLDAHDPLHAAMTAADHAMYDAKRSGGNTARVVV